MMFYIRVSTLLILVFAFYFPLTVVLGGWDDNSISDLRIGGRVSVDFSAGGHYNSIFFFKNQKFFGKGYTNPLS